MYTVLVVVQVTLAIGIIGLVLLQHGKGADAGAAFGSGASGTVFGARGSATFLSRGTGVLAALFFAVSLALAVMVARGGVERQSVTESLVDAPAATVEEALSVPAELSAPAEAAAEAPAESVEPPAETNE